MQNNTVENNPIVLVKVWFELSQQHNLLRIQKAVCRLKPIGQLYTAPASPNSFHRIGKRQECDVTENRPFTDREFCRQVRHRIIPSRDNHCINRSSPFHRIQPCSLLPARDTNSIAKIPDTFCHDSISYRELFTFCHISDGTSPCCTDQTVFFPQ